ncbi:probable serine/threonine-protein kinase DDB_G0282963 isoform X4 [Lucilia sericata]|uniref:probable serine/threonine-protein kinase DDB_G0282963 isoform X4 n=1 Tax=Lucilia sericata TaxID=13632 RepID=UPI0018A8533C|nr:probable serine/threonine-protein kinase DDB_G0282963 isoform X4 [Lucilia sericata]
MELPSMVQRSGDTLIVRSVVSGNPIYMDQESAGNNNNNNNKNNNMNSPQTLAVTNNPNTLLMEHFQQLKRTQEHLMQQQQQNIVQEQQRQQAAAMELKEEGLPQCKIKRNYSCNYCTYFTQNPRYHLTHLRDVHGEKIVINKCKLCLYASRHYQKLVRHMKMVHGCTDGIASGHGQARGKRGMNREARKRKLEESVPATGVISALSVEAINAEHLKADMEHQKMQRDIEAFKKQQEEQQKSQQQKFNEAIFAAAAYEQLRVQREIDNRESLKVAATHSNYEQQQQQTSPVQNREDSPSQNRTYETATPAHQQHHSTPLQMTPQRSSLELTPSPSGSNSSPPPALALPPPGHQQHSDARSAGSVTPLGASDEPSNNRLMKCSLCDFTTLYRNHLLEHEIEDHCNAKFYRCEKCSYVTHIKARFSKHVKYHSMPMIKCVTCDFRTPYKWNLDRHMKNHGGAGPFKCAACDFTADIKQSLTVHEMNHHVPPVGHAAGMTLARRRNKVGGTDLNEDFFSDSAEMLEDHFNNNNMDEYDEMLMTAGPIGMYETKRLRYDDDEPTDLSQKGGSSDTSSVHNSNLSIPKAKKPLPNLIPITKESENILNLSTDLASRSSLSEIASMFFNEKQISEMLQPADKTEAMAGAASQLSPTTTITSSASSRSLLNRKTGSFFDKIKSSSATNENLICPCGHMAKCLSESIIHRKTCTFSPLSANDDMDLDDDEHDEDGEEGRLEIDFTEDEECDKQSHSALNLSVTGSTRCQHCRHRCKSSVDLLNHLKICSEANSRCDSLSGDSCAGSRVMLGDTSANELQHPMENRVFIWNKLPRNQQEGSGGGSGSQSSDGNQRQQPISGNSSSNAGGSLLSANNDENSYYGVETAPGYGEVTKKMTPEEEAANSSLKKVYKCPHCSFWASTASRFHVHIVGHLNKKPFECSLCSYRSNWRWDITKHIRLKTIRDPSHKNARVLMNDETGRRNYTKYNKYITLMKVTEEDGDPKLMKSGEMTPNQVASLAFINDYNNKQQSNTSTANSTVNNILNGVREDITLEPIPAKASVPSVDDQLSDNFIRLPFLASMVNAAMAQQQQQNDNEQNAPTLITPSVTISAVKKSPPVNQNYKPSDEITLEVRQEGNEKITNYKCRKCNFRHVNRDAVLAHVKVHFPDTNHAMISPKSLQQMSSNSNGLQVAVNPNLYMNKVLAAMCLSQQQQQQQQQQQHNSNPNAQLTNLMAAGLLDQANNTNLSGLALALAGKSPLKTSHLNAAANIIEHGEQKASLNERHCRLKHAGVINIETLDRTATNDRHATPIYKPLVNGATNESNNNHNNNSNSNNTNSTNSHYNLTLKALQQQQNQNNNHNTVLINNNNNNLQLKNANNVLKTETNNNNNILPSSIATALNAANTTQDLQAAVVYLAAAYKAATNQTNSVNTLANLPAITSMAEELLLQQQLQQNDQIEITRVSSSNHNNSSSNNILTTPTTANNSNLAQLLESNLNSASNRVSSPQHNAKSKQQKCPLCTYICDSKSQMNYHISLHKPTQYECRMCTFVCAKKQHLSSHMRTVHQMQQNQILAATSNPSQTTNANSINMDFGLALQIATAAQNQDSTNLTTPLAIDLSASPVARPSTTLTQNNQHQNHQSQLPPEYQYRMIYYCNKCPARYAQKHNDPLTAQKDLDEHLRQHENNNSSSSEDKRKYHCDYCDYRAMHESIIQTHRYVHTTQYQEKCNELYKNCKEDSVYRAPKLMHITATKKPHMHETIWVVDHDLNEGHHHQQQQQQTKHHQNSVITSSSQSNSYEAGNSLLKKQLESRQVSGSGTATAAANEELRNSKPNQAEADDSNTASTSASVATGDLAHENESRPIPIPEDVSPEKTSSDNDNKEKCEHCPFESSNEEEFKTHLQQHICVSQQKLAHICEHCDYSAEEQDQIEEHTRVHFNGNEKLKDVSFFTRYDNLEISMKQPNEENNEEENVNIKKEIPNNNNNEENRVNENLKDSSGESIKVNTEPKQPKCAKIILYKNDGCLTIKKETNEQSNQNQQQQQQQTSNNITENISDRLRRRISRQGAAAGATSNQEEQTLTATSTSNTSHKTILVNAKTGQVISRN